MCGIAGIIQWETPIEDGIIERMTETIQHRGPDATDYKKYEHAHFGHQRLAIIDVTYGHQPMTKEHGAEQYTIVYNGELYNAASLRKELEQLDYQFTTNCDTEVLLISYIHWGPSCLERLNGIFSFGVWEKNAERLFLARDRFGVKPLFYVQQANTILFASEIKALLTHPMVEPVVTKRGIQQLLTIGPSRMLGETVFHQIKEIKPAHAMLSSRHESKMWRYWQLEESKHEHNAQQTVLHTRNLLEETMQQQIVSDVPVCTLLSGGVDSSIITALVAKEYERTGQPLYTFSVDYEEQDQFFKTSEFLHAQDDMYIQLVKERYNTIHNNVILKPDQLAESLERALLLKDYPGMTDIDSSLFLFCKEIAKDFKVALSGECADELFAGYPWYFGQYDNFPWVRAVKDRESLLRKPWRENLQLERAEQEFYKQASDAIPYENEQHRMSQLNFDYFMQTLLERKDRMSMGSGLEVRVPFANHELVEYVWNVPWEIKTLNGQAKGLLREAAKDLLPKDVLERRKNPYPKVQHPQYTAAVTKLLQEALLDYNSILYELFDVEALQQLIEDDSALQTPWYGQLMSRPQFIAYLYQLDLWMKQYNIKLML